MIFTLRPVSSVVPHRRGNSQLTTWWVRCQEVCSRTIRRPLDHHCQLCSEPQRRPHPSCSGLRPRSAALVSSDRQEAILRPRKCQVSPDSCHMSGVFLLCCRAACSEEHTGGGGAAGSRGQRSDWPQQEEEEGTQREIRS